MKSKTAKTAKKPLRVSVKTPVWAWWTYAVAVVVTFLIVYRIFPGPIPPHRLHSLDDPEFIAVLFGLGTGVFVLLILMAVFEPIIAGVNANRTKGEIARNVAVVIGRAGVELMVNVLIEGALGAATSGTSGSSSSRGGSSGGGGSFGGGGASGSW